MGTPKEVASSLIRAWEIEPTSERIIEDIRAFPRVLQVIIDRDGVVVPDLFLRSGRRYEKIKGNGECKNKPRSSQRKITIKRPPLHPHCIRAYDAISQGQIALAYEEADNYPDDESDYGQLPA
jgi:hypothetical protein